MTLCAGTCRIEYQCFVYIRNNNIPIRHLESAVENIRATATVADDSVAYHLWYAHLIRR
jgi:hypothetical protein